VSLKDRLAAQRADDGADPNGALVGRYRRLLLEEVDLEELSQLSAAQRRARLERVVGHMLTRDGPVLSSIERSSLIRQVVDEALGLGVLEPLLADETVTEIMVNGPHSVFVERNGRLEQIDARFADEAQMYQTIDRIVAAVNRRVDESSPMVDARLPGGERVNVIIPPLSLTGPIITIRRFPTPFSVAELIGKGSLDEPTAALLEAIVSARLNVIISGGTGTGKTTFLNALSGFIGVDERIITIEDSAELSLRQPHVVSLESRPASVEGKGAVTIRDLVRNSLRMRPDRIIVGEVRGGETLDMLQAMNTGHEGSLATVHANSAEDAVVRLETLASMSELDIAFDALRDQINSAVDVIVHLSRASDGTRRVAEVAAVASRRREAFRLAEIVRFEPEPMGVDRVSRGHWEHHALPTALAERLAVSGVALPDVFTMAEPAPVRGAG
jgi:pilus assembly protein CpaF